MIARLALRGLAAHKLRLAVTTVAVVLGVAFVSGAMIFSATTNAALDRLFATAGKGIDAVVRAQQPLSGSREGGGSADQADRPVPASVLKAVESTDGVAKAHGSVTGFAAVVVDNQGTLVTSAQGAPQIGVDWTNDPDFAAMQLKAGRGPRTPGEVAVDSATAEKAGHRVGDRVTVALRGPSRTFTLTGIFAFGGSTSTGGMSIAAFEPATAQRLLMEQPGTYRQIDVHARPGVSQRQVRDAVARVLPSGFEAVTGREASDAASGDLRASLDIFPRLLLWFSLVAVFVGAFIIANTFSMLVAQRTRELALLRAVGASRGQLRRLVLGEAAGVGLVGSALGLCAGAGLAAGLRAVVNSVGGDEPSGGLVLSGPTVGWSFAVGALVTLVAAYVPARRAATIPPVAAMRDEAVRQTRSLRSRGLIGMTATAAGTASMALGVIGTGTAAQLTLGAGALLVFVGVMVLSPLLGRPAARVLGWPFARLFGAAGALSRQNAQRNPRRTAVTASALMVGLALSGAVTVLASSLKTSLDRQLDEGLGADYVVSSSSETPFSPQALDAVARIPGVQSAVAVRTVRLELDGRARSAVAGDPQELAAPYRLTMAEGTLALAVGELLISHDTARSNDWAVGGTVSARYPDGATARLRVAGIYADSPVGPAMILDPASYRAHYPSKLVSQIEIIVEPGANTAATRQALKSALRAWPGLDLQDQSDIKAAAHDSIDEFVSAILVLLALSVLIAALGIMNTLALSVIERTREIGVLRAVGMGRGQLRRMIRYEAVVISVYGALLGLGLGVLYGWALQQESAADGMTVLSIPFGQLGRYLLAAVVIGVVAAVWPARHAARIPVLRAISHE